MALFGNLSTIFIVHSKTIFFYFESSRSGVLFFTGVNINIKKLIWKKGNFHCKLVLKKPSLFDTEESRKTES